MIPARLILEDGTVYTGEAFGSVAASIGEVVFNTSMTGYQEICTDPSYRFQIVVMTYPHMGNYGTSPVAEQSDKPQVAGLAVRELSPPGSLNSDCVSLESYLHTHGVAGIAGLDTRALTRKIRSAGAMRGMISTDSTLSDVEAVRQIKNAPSMSGLDLVQKVTALRPYALDQKFSGQPKRRIAVYDFGVKRDILRRLAADGSEIIVYPATTHAEEILNAGFDGVVLSNGPGDPEPVTYAQENIRKLIGRVPLLGICLGHQLLGIALGGKTFKLKFGHRGGNHPVQEISSGKIEITAQNHGFAVDAESLPASEIEQTHINLNDGTLEGFRHRSHPLIAIQYHPESAPGPHDSFHIFTEFAALVDEVKARS